MPTSNTNILFDILHRRSQAIAEALDGADMSVTEQAVATLHKVAEQAAAQGSAEHEASVDHVHAVLCQMQSTHTMAARAQTLLQCAIFYDDIGQNHKGIQAGETGLVLAETAGDQATARRLCNILGMHYMQTTNYLQGMLRLDRGLQFARQLHDPLGEAAIIANVIGLFTDAGLYKDALHACHNFPKLPFGTAHYSILNFQCAINGLFSALRLNQHALCEHYIEVGNALLPSDVIGAEMRAMFAYYQALYYAFKDQTERLYLIAQALRIPENAASNLRLHILHDLARAMCEFGQGQTDIATTRLMNLRVQAQQGVRYYDHVLQALILVHEKQHNHFEALALVRELTEYMARIKKANYHRQLRAMGIHTATPGGLHNSNGHDELERIEHDAAALRVQAARHDAPEAEYATAESWAITAELLDDDTGEHCLRVGLLARLLAQAAGCEADFCQRIEYAARLHDLGKLGVAHTVLLKPGKLNPNELASMRYHTVIGHDLLIHSTNPTLRMGAAIARYHHEWFNGHGYPDGLYGDHIPLEARLCAVAEVFDTLTHERRYKRAWSRQEALAEIHAMADRQFDPALTRLLPKVLRAFDTAMAARNAAAVQQARQVHLHMQTQAQGGFLLVKESLLAKLAQAAPLAA
jgi:putative two-component system response regulator